MAEVEHRVIETTEIEAGMTTEEFGKHLDEC